MTGEILITHAERATYRGGLKETDGLIRQLEKALTGSHTISTKMSAALQEATKTSEMPGQLRMLRSLHSDMNRQYDTHLLYAAPHNLSSFCEYICREEVPAQHHEFLIDHLVAVADHDVIRLMISMPPGHAKSTYSSHRFPAWYLGRNPDHKWIQAAYNMDFARNRLGKPVRAIINSPRYVKVFPQMGIAHDSAAADFFEFSQGNGYYKAVGVGVGIAGYRANIQAIDDPFKNQKEAENQGVRDDVFNWYIADFTTRMVKKGTPQFIVATRWHMDDLCGRLEDMTKRGEGIPFEIINLPATAIDDDPMGREFDEALWPDQFDYESLMEFKSGAPSRVWNSLYMGNPIDEEGGVLNRDNVYRYETIPEDIMSGNTILKKVVKRVTLSIDAAEKDTQRSDYTAATIWVETVDRKHYLKHAARIRKRFNEIVGFIDHLAKEFKVDVILCEDKGAGTQYIQIRQDEPGPAPVIAIQTQQQSKAFRFDGVSPMFDAKQVFLPAENTAWVSDVEAELFSFPNGTHDDYVDTVSQYLKWTKKQNVRRGVAKMQSGYA